MKNLLEKLKEELKRALKDNLKSIILYGSKASQEDTKYSDYNILVVVEKIDIEDLKNLKKATFSLIKHKNPPPLIFTKSELIDSLDVFPIEFLDIKDNHLVLYGEDPFKELTIDTKNLRHECEFELRSKLLKLRQAYLLLKGKPKKLKKLMIETISTFLVLFKSIIKISTKTAPIRKIETLTLIKELINIDTQPFETILLLKQSKLKKEPNYEELFKSYIKEIEKVINWVDKLKE